MRFTVIRAGVRSRTATAWLTSHHSFSFGDHYDPSNTHHGALLAFNEEHLAVGQGFPPHHHQETEIVTWVSSGTLIHHDSSGHAGVVYPGLVQRMSAGRGVDHAETNEALPDHRDTGQRPVHYVQMWLAPDQHGIEPSYDQCDVSADLASGALVPVVSGDPIVGARLSLANRHATLYVCRTSEAAEVTLPPGRFTHLFVMQGSMRWVAPDSAVDAASDTDSSLGPGDAARGVDTGGERIAVHPDTEILLWTMNRALGEP